MLPYGKQSIDEDDIKAVIEVLKSDWLTTGPKIEEFEQAIVEFVGAKYAVAVSSGTAALHAAMFALNIGPGDEVIVSPMTFAATANCVVYQGGTPVFADVDPETLLIDPKQVEKKITSRTKAIIAVDYAGQPCNYDELLSISKNHNIPLVADSCHALGALYKGRPVGSIADLAVFSFHPVKHITTGEGGMITTNNEEYAKRMRIFRNHGITTDHRQREKQGSWFYEMVELGYNYRITDIQCGLGISQLKKLPQWIKRRWEIAAKYDEELSKIPGIKPLGLRSDVLLPKQSLDLSPFPFPFSPFSRSPSSVRPCPSSVPRSPSPVSPSPSSILHPPSSVLPSPSSVSRSPSSVLPSPSSVSRSPFSVLRPPSSFFSTHAYHLYVIRIEGEAVGKTRDEIFRELRNAGIGVNVHYIPVHLHPFYRKRLGTSAGLCRVAEAAYEQIISLPMFPKLTDKDVYYIIESIKRTSN